MTKTGRAFLKALSAVLANLSAAWFALAIVTPNVSSLSNNKAILVLTMDITIGILFLVITAIIERILNDSK